ncbi:McrB family protein [Acinetobacter venetianus]|uniref:McrB family protein n=1 Tax=Acinetobacter venetianus TaxID=52133 RepID=UPI00241DD2F0|nr:AAA family ATPase [Acinetobacter venetianus]HJP46556.1 AAA family ATPase [Acinetobacter venetianus]
MELEEFKQKFNLPRISEYVALLSQEQSEWFWELLQEIKEVFPNIDIYPASTSNFNYLGFGIKKIKSKRVSAYFFALFLRKNEDFILHIPDQTYRLLSKNEELLPQAYNHDVQKKTSLKDWLFLVKKSAEEVRFNFEGNDLFPVNYEAEDYFSTEEAYDFLKKKYKKNKEESKKIVGFTNNANREIALILDNLRPSLFIGCDPQNNQFFEFDFIENNSKIYGKYEQDDGRHHGLKSHTPSLDKGNNANYIEINSLTDLEKFCEWYELDTHQSIDNSNSKVNKEMSNKILQPLNRILFGAAGTGKTFNTINHAISIIEDKSLEELQTETREELKKRFDNYKNQGQIKFVTFHQSFSYEDFVEGIRAKTDDQGNLTYDEESGVFKELCEDAEAEIKLKKVNELTPTEISINGAIDNLINRAKNEEIIFHTKRGMEIRVTSNSSGTLFSLTSKDNNIRLSTRHIRNYLKTQSDIIVDQKSYEWAIANSLRSEIKYEKKMVQPKPYILIIDEINRGNISRIFGELITLIEDSKRQGAEEALSVTLPYSKEEFSIPHNLYLIGTMNSSDRSLTGLDIALRRRFTFIEMPPRPELLDNLEIDGVNVQELLTVINQRIEILLDRDHCLGHANFMSLEQQPTLENLSNIFKQKVIPQLQEYFFDDWAKINLVLNGNGMLKPKPVETSAIFPNVDSEELGYFEDKKIWELVPTSFNSIESFKKIIQY